MKHIELETILIKNNNEINEKWVQEVLADNPALLGLGDIVLRDKERIQPKAGRLDLLFQDPDTNKRYEVEVQLGNTDESHIIRTIEYWDVERKRYPQYDHSAVIVAENITSRFLNVISLFNGFIPFIAIQMRALKVADGISLTFTKILDEMTLGLIDEDEESNILTDRNYWLKRGSKKTVALADKLFDIVQAFAPDYALKYNKFYIGLAKDNIANNFVAFKPKKQWVAIEIRLDEKPEMTLQLENSGVDGEYMKKWGKYRIRLRQNELSNNADFLNKIFLLAYQQSQS